MEGPSLTNHPIKITTGYYADGEPTDGWHWFAKRKRDGKILAKDGPFKTEISAKSAGTLWLVQQ